MSNTKSSSGITFTGALTVLFIGLKLGKIIDWSWWWVLSPLWISLVFFLIILVLIYGGVWLLDYIQIKRMDEFAGY